MNFKKYHVSRNLWTVYPNQTYRGVTFEFTNNTIKMNNTCTQEGNIGDTISLKAGTYTIAANANINISQNTHILQIYKANVVSETISLSDMISGKATFTIAEDTTDILIRIHVMNGVDYSGLEIRPMLNTGSTALPYEPYSSEVWHDTPHYIHNTSTDTITTLPAELYPNATTATVGLKGQAVQSGTPTRDNPVMPQGTGERTGNLFDVENVTHETLTADGSITYESAMNLSVLIRVDGDYTVSWKAVRSGAYMRVSTYDDNKNFIARVVAQNTYTRSSYSSTHTGYIRINYENSYQLSDVQVNTGSTALPYEPYGYKIPILSADTTTPIYLGEVETTRKIRKLVLTGEEDNWKKSTAYQGSFYNTLLDTPAYTIPILCSHAVYTQQITPTLYVYGKCTVDGSGVLKNLNLFIGEPSWSVSDFQQYLAQQYAAGTPVCVWYVLAEPTTGTVNEPLMRIGDYADTLIGISIPVTAGGDTLSVGTTVQPSEVTVNYKGWHPVADVHEFTGNYTVGTMQTLPISELETHTISDLQGGEWS